MAQSNFSLPDPGEQTPEAYLQMSGRFVEHAEKELELGDRVQASEKISGAVAAALKAIAQRRQWRHDSHALRSAIVTQLGAEIGPSSDDAQVLYRGRAAANEQHQNFYENSLFDDDILRDIEISKVFLGVVERLLIESPKPYTVSRSQDARRIAQLTGHEPDLGVTDARGFASFAGEARQA